MKIRSGHSSIAAYRNTETAPVVFFDGPVAWAVLDGVIAIELGVRAMVPVGEGEGEVGAETEGHIAARIRCSPAAARHLRDVIIQTLDMLDRPQNAAATALGKLN
jgi:hypothetical protein